MECPSSKCLEESPVDMTEMENYAYHYISSVELRSFLECPRRHITIIGVETFALDNDI